MERDAISGSAEHACADFNSHAHVERDAQNGKAAGRTLISTHTLTWSVTMGSLTALYTRIISTHTLTWSVTKCRSHLQKCRSNFNSHAHVERDWQKIVISTWRSISTHTLTWSVTARK